MKKRITKEVKLISIFIIIVLIILVVRYISFEVDPIKESIIIKGELDLDQNSKMQVYIVGEVINPGVYKMEKDDRINDLIIKAGGFTEYADESRINLAEKLSDEKKIIVYKVSDESEIIYIGIDILNYSSKEKLLEIDNIGEVLATRIINYRENRGLFSSFDDLLNVEGIGEKKLESIIKSTENE